MQGPERQSTQPTDIRDRGVAYVELCHDLRIPLRAGELVRLTAQVDPDFNRRLVSRGMDINGVFGKGEETGDLSLDHVVDRLINFGGTRVAFRLLDGTLSRIGKDYKLNGDKENVIGYISRARQLLTKGYRSERITRGPHALSRSEGSSLVEIPHKTG